MLADFPGPVAIPVESVRGMPPLVGSERNDGEPWAIEIGYAIPGQHLLTVRTVRSPEGLNPRGLAVESIAGAVVNFIGTDQNSRPHGMQMDVDAAEARIRDQMSASRRTYDSVAAAPRLRTVVVIDGVAIEGSRVDQTVCSAVELAWGKQIVFCTGQPDIIDALRLRSAIPDDFRR